MVKIESNRKIEGPRFGISMGKGFHIIFDNGYTASVQFGPGNYCGDYPHGMMDFDAPKKTNLWESKDAEIACWDPDHEFVHLDGDDVDGRKNPAEVLTFLNWVADGCKGDYPLKEVRDAI